MKTEQDPADVSLKAIIYAVWDLVKSLCELAEELFKLFCGLVLGGWLVILSLLCFAFAGLLLYLVVGWWFH